MRPLWEVLPGERRHPLAHLLLNQQHLLIKNTKSNVIGVFFSFLTQHKHNCHGIIVLQRLYFHHI